MAEKKSFEKSMEELSKVVSELEQGQLELDRALTLFEKGVKLSKECQIILDKAQQKVSRLTQDEEGGLEETPFA